MSGGYNRVTLLGNLGADPELRFTQAGAPVMNMRLATTESYVDKDKNRQEKTEWHSVVLWGPRAEALAKFLKKGERLMVEGSLRTSSYEKDGSKRYKTEINAKEVILCGGKRDGDTAEAQPRTTSPNSSTAPSHTPAPDAFGPQFTDDDIPF